MRIRIRIRNPSCNEQERREYQLAVPYYRMSQLPPLAVLERLELSNPPLNPGSRPPLTSSFCSLLLPS
jgi:hypothetical protein